MASKKRRLEKSRLYLIFDKEPRGFRSLPEVVKKIKGSGIDIIQFRDKRSKKERTLKDALSLRKLLADSGILFIINDHLDVAKVVNSDGVHLGQKDASIKIARKILGKDKIIGVSCHSLKQALCAQKNGADYIGIGPVYPTATKPGYKTISKNLLQETSKKIRIPFFAIGGIKESNINEILAAGVKRVAVCRAILEAKNISRAVKYFSEILR